MGIVIFIIIILQIEINVKFTNVQISIQPSFYLFYQQPAKPFITAFFDASIHPAQIMNRKFYTFISTKIAVTISSYSDRHKQYSVAYLLISSLRTSLSLSISSSTSSYPAVSIFSSMVPSMNSELVFTS